MNKPIRTLLMVGFFLGLINSEAFPGESLREIKLPAEINLRCAPISRYNTENGLGEKQKQINSGGMVLRDNSTGCPRRVIGAPEKIQGYAQLTESNIEEASRAFLKSKESELGLRGIGLKLQRATNVNGRWYVTFRQTYQGLEVMLTEVELRIFENGNVALYGADIIPNIEMAVIPKLGYEAAINKLSKEIEGKASVDRSLAAKRPCILPIKNSNGVGCRLVWRSELVSREGRRYVNYTDANDGESVWRFAKTRSALSEIEVSGLVKENKATDQPKYVKFNNMYVKVGDKQYLTDGDGKIKIDIPADAPITATLAGPYAKVSKKSMGKSALLTDTLSPSEIFDIEWNDKNSHAFERAVFFHTNLIHADLKSIDPKMDYMDYQMNIVVNFAGESPNAYSNGADSITFVCASSTKMNMPESPSILYHEYTHAANDQIYGNLGSLDGMTNYSANEALADLYSCLLQREPRIGLGTFKADSNKYIRCIDNDYTYPEDLSTDSHHNGQILAGAFWDLAKTTSYEYVKKLSHFTKYGLPDDPDIGVAFSEWFIETLIADDDDGNLANETPHSKEIRDAFNKHHIGTDLLTLNSFDFVPLADTQDTLHALPVLFKLKAPSVAGGGIEKVKVIYSVDNWVTSNELEAHPTSEDNYEAQIPSQPAGSFVCYYILAEETSAGREINLIKSRYMENYLSFAVGYKTFYVNECEKEDGWKFGDSSDYENFGYWECDVPRQVDLTELSGGTYGFMQIGRDHSPNGEKCFVTDAAGTDFSAPLKYIIHMAQGKRTLYSPAFSLKDFKKPLIKFWRFNTLSKLSYPEAQPTFSVYVSGDEGASWALAAAYTNSTQDWKPELINLPALLPGAESVSFKFVAQNDMDLKNSKFNHCEALIDDIEFLDLSSALAVCETSKNENLTVYPNPAVDVIYLPSNVSGCVIITDALGNIINRLEVNGGSIAPIRVWDLPGGVYFIKLISGAGTEVVKFIKI
ncbi:MAG: T9SS type A sorting domain-containing protein [Chloroflexota bacterium]